MTTLAARLRRLKARRRVTVKEIARGCGVSPQTVHGWLVDKHPRTNHLASLATYFDVTTDYLINGDQSGARAEIIQELRVLVPHLSNHQLLALLITAKEFAKKT